MKPIIDAHLDLAWCALHWNRDLTLPLAIYGTFSVEIHPNIFAFGVLTTLFSLCLLAVYAVLMTASVRRARQTALQEEA